MQVTRNDLSYQSATLDMQALIQTARIAKHACITNIQDLIKPMNSYIFHSKYIDETKYTGYKLMAEQITREVGYLQVICETLDALLGSEQRWDCQITNRTAPEEE